MKTILVPTDFSAISQNALDYAIALAKKLNARITLLHSYYTFQHTTGLSEVRSIEEAGLFKEESEIKLRELCREVTDTFSCPCDFINREGLAKDVIADTANEVKPYLMVMGTESLSPLDRIVFGTTTGKVINKADCPVLVVPEDAPYQTPQKMAFAMDYHDSDIEEIRFMTKLAREFGSEMHIVHVATDEVDMKYEKSYFADFKEEIKSAMPGQKFIYQFIEGKKVAKELETYAREIPIDILAVAKVRKNMIERLFTGSVSQRLFHHTRIPLLVFQVEKLPNDLF